MRTKEFHELANEGKAITRLRLYYVKQGIYITAYRIEIIIRLHKMKRAFNKKES